MSWIKQGKVGRPPIDDVTHEMLGAPRMTSDIVRQVSELEKLTLSNTKPFSLQNYEFS